MKTFPSYISVLLFSYFAFCSICANAQKIEININAYSGLFSYRSNGASKTTAMVTGIPFTFPDPTPFIENSYGKNSAFPFSIEVQALRSSKNHFLYGTGLSYESFTSKVIVNKVKDAGDYVEPVYDATGKATLHNSYINLNPFVGKRFFKSKISFDVLSGFDLGICLMSHEKGNARRVDNGKEYTTDNNKTKPSIDFRPRIQFKVQSKRTGVLLGYSIGLTNYQKQGNSNAYTSFLRLGISYNVK